MKQQARKYDPERRNVPTARERAWALLRLVLGIAQMTGATAGFILLAQTGLSEIALLVVVATGLLTTVSVLLFGRRKS